MFSISPGVSKHLYKCKIDQIHEKASRVVLDGKVSSFQDLVDNVKYEIINHRIFQVFPINSYEIKIAFPLESTSEFFPTFSSPYDLTPAKNLLYIEPDRRHCKRISSFLTSKTWKIVAGIFNKIKVQTKAGNTRSLPPLSEKAQGYRFNVKWRKTWCKYKIFAMT